MARRKRARRTTHRRHRKMGDPGKNFLMSAVGLVAGAAAARVLTASPKILPNIDGKIKSAGVVALGYFFPKLVKGDIGNALGAGMIAAGGLGLLQATNILAGVDDSLSIPVSVMAGDDVSVIAGYTPDNLSVVAGMEEEYGY